MLFVMFADGAQHTAWISYATTLAGMSFVTTLPAPITVSSPTVTPGTTITPAPNQQLRPMRMGRLYWYAFSRSSGRIGWLRNSSHFSVDPSRFFRYCAGLTPYSFLNTRLK